VTSKAVILARGIGTRMRRSEEGVPIDPAQASAADRGVKGMIPFGRPFLDYVLSGLADAGYRDVCLVIGPEHDEVRDYYTRQRPPSRVRVWFAVQERPLGTANAVAAAATFAGTDRFLVINSDNYYPADVCRQLRELESCGLAAFERESLVRQSNIEPARVLHYAVLELRPDLTLASIVEKPDADVVSRIGGPIYVSMNCWIFGPSIFRAAAAIEPSPRGELEIASAVEYAIAHLGETFVAVPVHAGVLDLSRRGDIAEVGRRLEGLEVRP
jgi:dTDP-glucose pyrophosphorylase